MGKEGDAGADSFALTIPPEPVYQDSVKFPEFFYLSVLQPTVRAIGNARITTTILES